MEHFFTFYTWKFDYECNFYKWNGIKKQHSRKKWNSDRAKAKEDHNKLAKIQKKTAKNQFFLIALFIYTKCSVAWLVAADEGIFSSKIFFGASLVLDLEGNLKIINFNERVFMWFWMKKSFVTLEN